MRTKRRVERTLRLQQQGKSTETVSSNHRLNPHLSVVVRLAGDRIGAARDEHVGFRPVGLHRAGFDRRGLNRPVHSARVGADGDARAVLKAEPFGVFGSDEDRVPARSR